MFTGIITASGRLLARSEQGSDQRLHIGTGALPLEDAAVGESIAVNGVCLTAVAFSKEGFHADVSAETLRLTTLGDLAAGEALNLERALRLSDRLGGHLVSGHVDGLAEVRAVDEEARSLVIELRAPPALARYIARKGSVALDGVSLTVNAVQGSTFRVNIVPHTAQVTNIGSWRPGSRVNLEVDVMARYLERLDSAARDLAGEEQ